MHKIIYMRTLSTIFAISAILFVGTLNNANVASAYNIADAIRSSLKNNAELHAQQEEITKAKISKEAIVMGRFFPSVSVRRGFMTNSVNIPDPDNKQKDASITVSESFENPKSIFQVSIQQNLFSSLGDMARLQGSQHVEKVSMLRYESVRNNKMMSVIDLYTGILFARTKYQLSIYEEEIAFFIINLVKQRLEAGSARPYDVDGANANMLDVFNAKERQKADLTTFEAKYVALTGDVMPPNANKIDLQQLNPPLTFNEFKSTVLKRSLNISMAAHNRNAAKFNVFAAKSAFFPQINLEINPSAIGASGWQKQYNPQISIISTIPLINGQVFSDLRSAQADFKQKNLLFVNASAVETANITEVWGEYQKSINVMKTSMASASFFRSYFKGILTRYAAGSASLEDVLSAYRQFFRRRYEELDAIRAYQSYSLLLFSYMNSLADVDFNMLVGERSDPKMAFNDIEEILHSIQGLNVPHTHDAVSVASAVR